MAQILLLTVGALVVGAIGFGVAVLISGSDPGLAPVEAEGSAIALPSTRPLVESDLDATRFDTALRGYRMAQVDTALRRAAYDIGYKQELIGVLEAEIDALRTGRADDAEKLRAARETALNAIADRAGASPPGVVEEDGPGEMPPDTVDDAEPAPGESATAEPAATEAATAEPAATEAATVDPAATEAAASPQPAPLPAPGDADPDGPGQAQPTAHGDRPQETSQQ